MTAIAHWLLDWLEPPAQGASLHTQLTYIWHVLVLKTGISLTVAGLVLWYRHLPAEPAEPDAPTRHRHPVALTSPTRKSRRTR